MSTSGTATFSLDYGEICEEAFERAGLELKSGYDYRTARRSLNLLSLEWGNRGVNLPQIEQKTLALTLAAGASYSLPADTIDVLDGAIRTGAGTAQSDILIPRVGYDVYLSVPNKAATGRPVQYTILRGSPPTITFWEAPDGDYTFLYYRMRRIQDASAIGDTPDVPARFVPAMVAGLAYYIGMKRPEVADRLPLLKAVYDEQWAFAIQEDHERSTVRIYPRICA